MLVMIVYDRPPDRKNCRSTFESITKRHPLLKITSYSIDTCRIDVKIVYSRR